MSHRIRFNAPFIIGKEYDYISDAVSTGRLSGDGRYTRRCQRWLEANLRTSTALLSHSGTAALEMAALLCDVGPGDEIIMPSFTFVSTANAFVLRGATPVFVDISESDLNIDPDHIEKAITKKTKAIVAVHYAGMACDMGRIMEIANNHGILVVEDAAQAMLSRYEGRYLGAIGHLGCLSFHETKNIISGEGGALLINDNSFRERARVIWEKGTNRQAYFSGSVDKYSWVDVGSSFLPNELTAAFLMAQLENAQTINNRRQEICRLYYRLLAPLQERGRIRLPPQLNHENNNGHIFYILTKNLEERNKLIEFLDARSILATFHYVPLHSSPAGRRFGRSQGVLNITDDISRRLVRLPLHYLLADGDVSDVVSAIHSYYGRDSGVPL